MEIHFNCTVCADAPIAAFILAKLLAGKSVRATALETKYSISVVSRHTRRCIDPTTRDEIKKVRAAFLRCLICSDPPKAAIVERELLAGNALRGAVKNGGFSINTVLHHVHKCISQEMQLRIRWASLQTAKKKITAANAIRFAEVRRQRELQRQLKAEAETEMVLERKTGSVPKTNGNNVPIRLRPDGTTPAALRRFGSEMLQPGEFIGMSAEREARFLLALVSDTRSAESVRSTIPVSARQQAELKKIMMVSEVDRLCAFRDATLRYFDALAASSLDEIKRKAAKRRKQLAEEYARLNPNGPHSVPTPREQGDEWTI
jgi:hypothetical protein